MRIIVAAAIAAVVAALTPSLALAAPAVTVRRIGSGTVAPYAVTEFAVTVKSDAAPYANPFDPDEARVDAVLRPPKGASLTLPAYWSQPFRRERSADGAMRLVPTGEPPGWRVRAAFPPIVGEWTVTVTVHDRSGDGKSAPVAVPVRGSSGSSGGSGGRGFVRRASGPAGKRYFQYSDGSPFFLIGENVCWAQKKGLGDFETWFGDLGRAGGNYARLWMAFSPLESKATGGAGRYDLAHAAYFDEVLALAQQNGIVTMLALGTYGEFNVGGYFNEGRWPENPYSAANGGPVPADKPDAFFTDPAARALYRRRLRYLVARYAAYASLGFWEFWNEKGGPAPWFAEMAAYLKATDPYKHLVTDSYSTTGDPAVWKIPDIDLTQTHRYGDEGSLHDFAAVIPPDARAHDVYGKPHLMGEFGIAWQRGDEHFDPAGKATNLHNGLWAGALSGDAGGAAVWWWDSYVAPKNLYREFTPLARFAAPVDWPRRDFQPLSLPAIRVRPAGRSASTAPPALQDLVLSPTGGWGETPNGTVTVHRDGSVTGGRIVSTLMGPDKPAQHVPFTLLVDLPRPSRLILRIGTVSVKGSLRVTLDGKPVADFPFDASPAAAGTYESTKPFPEYGGIYQALFNKDRAVALPAGRHTITLENTAGDWLSLTGYTLEKAHDPNEDTLQTVALQDAKTGETLAWLQDPESNWYHDRDPAYVPRTLDRVAVTIPVPLTGQYRITWWDTRTGKALNPDSKPVGAAPGRPAKIAAPAFTRDIALRAVRVSAKIGPDGS